MKPDGPRAERVARGVFWLAIILGCLSIAGMWFSLVNGALNAVILFGLALALRRGAAGPAIALGGFLLLPVLAMIQYSASRNFWQIAIAALIPLGMAAFAFWAAWVAWHGDRPRRVLPWTLALGLYAVLAVSLDRYVLPTEAMAPTLMPGDALVTENASWHLGRLPKHGEVVVFRYPIDPRQTFIKRVVGVPGDRLRIVHKQLYRNGQAVAEPYASHTGSYEDSYRDNFPSTPNVALAAAAQSMLQAARDGEIVVPAGKYFVMGDNRDNSLDSRYWGFLERKDIQASPLLVYDSHDLGDNPAGQSLRTWRTMRWSRIFRRL